MNSWQMALVFVAGVAAGTINTVVGSGTLITFPVLLGIGLPPVTANVSNTVGLVPGSLVGAWGYREELRGQRHRVLVMSTASVVGAVIGAVLLLVLPEQAFSAIVPVLLILALILVVFGKQFNKALARTGYRPAETIGVGLWTIVLLCGIYGGYFGAAQGVLMMGALGVMLNESLQRLNALKNVLTGLVNLVAGVVFMFTAEIDWTAVGLIAVGSGIGGLIGARVGRKLSPNVLRGVIVVVGIVAIVKLLMD